MKRGEEREEELNHRRIGQVVFLLLQRRLQQLLHLVHLAALHHDARAALALEDAQQASEARLTARE